MSIRLKLSFIVILILFGFGLVILLNFIFIIKQSDYEKLEKQVLNCFSNLQELNSAGKDLLSTYDLSLSFERWKGSKSNAFEHIKIFCESKTLMTLVKKNQELEDNYNAITTILPGIERDLNAVEDLYSNFIKNNEGNYKGAAFLLASDDVDDQTAFELFAIVEKANKRINTVFLSSIKTLIDSVNESIKTQKQMIFYSTLVLSIIIVFTIWLIIFRFSKLLIKRINKIEVSMGLVSERDLTNNIEIRTKDEIGKLAVHINGMQNTLRNFINIIKKSSDDTYRLGENVARKILKSTDSLKSIADNIESIKKQFENLNNNISNSSSGIQEIEGNIDSLANQIDNQAKAVNQSSESINEVLQSIDNVTGISNERRSLSETLVESIKIQEANTEETNNIVREIFDMTKSIQEILYIINDISAQTDLLAMNASIEAAHAGESGQGFSIVAEEIRKLAESTRENSKGIQELIKTVITNINNAIEISKKNTESFEKVKSGVDQFTVAYNEISEILGSISADSKEVLNVNNLLLTLTEEVKTGYKEMAVGTKELRSSLLEIENIAGTFLTSISEINSISQEVKNDVTEINNQQKQNIDSIEELNKEIKKFKT